MTWGDAEIAAAAHTFATTDPDQPTLCAGWTTRRLLAHLVVRSHHPVGLARDWIERRPAGQETALSRVVRQASTPEGYAALVDRFARPGSWLGYGRWLRRFDLAENAIHHEDVRRGGDNPAPPRDLPAGEVAELWGWVGRLRRLSYGRSPVPVLLRCTGLGTYRVGAGQAQERVILGGEPLELLLYGAGRRSAAHVEVSGPAAQVAIFEAWLTSRGR